jgi:hypothetical protein
VFINKLTQSSLILLEEPQVAQLLKNFVTFCWTRRFITVFTRALNWSLPETRWIQFIPPRTVSLRSYFIHCTFILRKLHVRSCNCIHFHFTFSLKRVMVTKTWTLISKYSGICTQNLYKIPIIECKIIVVFSVVDAITPGYPEDGRSSSYRNETTRYYDPEDHRLNLSRLKNLVYVISWFTSYGQITSSYKWKSKIRTLSASVGDKPVVFWAYTVHFIPHWSLDTGGIQPSDKVQY